MYVDSHCHLDFPDFAKEGVGHVVARARAAGVDGMLTISTHLSRFESVHRVAEAHENLWCTVGVHPHEAETEGMDDPAPLLQRTAHPKVVGIGETGLDFYYEHSPREAQARSFRAHIQAARTAGVPVVIHSRDADAAMIALLEEEHAAGPFDGVLHCFSSGPELARTALRLGLYISFSGIVTFKKAEAVRAVVGDVPLDRILVETDAPFLAPVPHRGKRNEPAFVVHTAAEVARLRGMEAAALARASTENFFRLFRKARPCA